jgi:hypothetical protein
MKSYDHQDQMTDKFFPSGPLDMFRNGDHIEALTVILVALEKDQKYPLPLI